MATKWQEKNVGALLRKGGSNKTPVINDNDGSVGGYQVEHWDDSKDAVVRPKKLDVSMKMQQKEE